MKKQLIEEICVFLLKKGFTTKILHYCFDILARKDSNILLIKVIENANSLNSSNLQDMIKISSYTNASMIIISEKSGVKLQDGVVYTRFGVSTVNLNTLKRAIDHKLPFIISKKSGLTAEILGKKLHNLRESMQMSARSLARKIQVSPRMISKYENEDSEISLNRAKKLYEIIGSAVFKEINIFESLHNQIEPERETNLTRKFHELGFSTTETKKTPFDLIAKSQREIILTRVGDKIDNELLLISKLMGTDDLVIFKKKKPKNIPALTKEEFMEIEKPNELIKVVKEF